MDRIRFVVESGSKKTLRRNSFVANWFYVIFVLNLICSCYVLSWTLVQLLLMQWRPGNGFVCLIVTLYIAPPLCSRFEVQL
jgi:hypothetical protein